jgi:DNA ligase-1
MKAMLASDYNEAKLVFPLGLQPKIDGVRGLTPGGKLLARSGKKHANRFTTAFFSVPEYENMDGEMAAADERDPRLCTITSSALRRIDGSPFVLWHVFDLLTAETMDLPYVDRYLHLTNHVARLQQEYGVAGHCRVVPMVVVNTLAELQAQHAKWEAEGYEGTIIRSLTAKHKQGRSTVKEGGLLRIKDFVEEEARVVGITEGQRNGNEAQVNERGLQFRSGHQENMVPNAQVGSMQCEMLVDSALFKAGQLVNVSPGKMTTDEALHYFAHQGELIGQVIKFKHFPKGVKDQPRFPTFVCIRSPEDM